MVVFHGSRLEQTDLLKALANHCTCDTDTAGVTTRCPGHLSLVTDQRFVDDLEFGRWRAIEMTVEEFFEEGP